MYTTLRASPNEIGSNSNLWQQYSPMAWSEMYNEYINYTRRMQPSFIPLTEKNEN